MELTPRQLAALFQNQLAAKICDLDLPLTDRATDKVLHKLYTRLPTSACAQEAEFIDRKQFIYHLRQALIQSGRANTQFTLCQLELDVIRVIVSVCGTDCEEALLHHIAAVIRHTLPKSAPLARLREGTFAILLPNHSLQAALEVAKNLRQCLVQNRFQWQNQDFSLDAHIGLVPIQWGDHLEQVLLNADATCLQAKHVGRNQIQIYRASDQAVMQRKELLMWAGKINKLFDEQQLFLRCQKIAPLGKEPGHHYEILVGAQDKTGRIILPDEFIPAVEHFKRGPDLDLWVVKETLNWMQGHRRHLDKINGFSINLSSHSILDESFEHSLHQLLYQHKDLTSKVMFEITESSAISSLKQASKFIRNFKRLGCKFALDYFGSGYASYAYLKHLNFDYLKIDGSFIKDILSSPADEEIVKSINNVAHSLGLKTIAEYAETSAIVVKLKALDINYAQGYGIAKPIPLHELKLDR